MGHGLSGLGELGAEFKGGDDFGGVAPAQDPAFDFDQGAEPSARVVSCWDSCQSRSVMRSAIDASKWM